MFYRQVLLLPFLEIIDKHDLPVEDYFKLVKKDKNKLNNLTFGLV